MARFLKGILLFPKAFRPALVSTQLLVLWLSKDLTRLKAVCNVKLTTRFHLLPRLTLSGATYPFPIHLRDVRGDKFTFVLKAEDGPVLLFRVVFRQS